jgi:hypothetical protein
VGGTGITDALCVNGILSTKYAYLAFQYILDVGTERCLSANENQITVGSLILPQNPRLYNPFVIQLLMQLLPHASAALRSDVFSTLVTLAAIPNLEAFTKVVQPLIVYAEQNTDQPIVWDIIDRIACYRLSTEEWRILFSKLRNEVPMTLLRILQRAAKEGTSIPFMEMEPGSKLNLTLNWGNNQGFTFGTWVYFYPNDNTVSIASSSTDAFTLMTLASDDGKSHLSVHITTSGQIELQTAPKTKRTVFGKANLEPGKWYHIAVTYQKYRLQNSTAFLFINGVMEESQKVSFNAPLTSRVLGSIGGCAETSPYNYRLGLTFLYEEALLVEAIQAMYVASPAYRGYYQGDYIPHMTPLSDHLLPNYIKLLKGTREQNIKVQPVNLADDKIMFAFNAANNSLANIDVKGKSRYGTGVYLESLHGDAPRAVLQGRVFPCVPSALSADLLNADGLGVVFALIERSETSEQLLDTLSLLLNLMIESDRIITEMDRVSGYDIVGAFLRKKGHLFTESIMQVLWQCVLLTTEGKDEVVTNLRACSRWILDYEIWRKTTSGIQVCKFFKNSKNVRKNCSKRSHCSSWTIFMGHGMRNDSKQLT